MFASNVFFYKNKFTWFNWNFIYSVWIFSSSGSPLPRTSTYTQTHTHTHKTTDTHSLTHVQCTQWHTGLKNMTWLTKSGACLDNLKAANDVRFKIDQGAMSMREKRKPRVCWRKMKFILTKLTHEEKPSCAQMTVVSAVSQSWVQTAAHCPPDQYCSSPHQSAIPPVRRTVSVLRQELYVWLL